MSQLLLATVVAATGRLEGRVKLQKMVYLLQEMGFDLGYPDFILLLYGPYSDSLAADLDRLTGNILDESEEPTGLRYRATGEPVMKYVYEARSPDLQKSLLELLEDKFGNQSKDLRERIAKLNSVPSPVLELVATAVYGRTEEDIAGGEKLWQWVSRLKGHLQSYLQQAKSVLTEWENQDAFQWRDVSKDDDGEDGVEEEGEGYEKG